MKDYYILLECSETSSSDDIKNSFRTLSKLWHPDINKSPGAAERFKKISVAYDWLKVNHKQKQQRQLHQSQHNVFHYETVSSRELREGEIDIYRSLSTSIMVHHTIKVFQRLIDSHDVFCHCVFPDNKKFVFRIPRLTQLPIIASIEVNFGRFRITIVDGLESLNPQTCP